mgnify:CR=1 FL=1
MKKVLVILALALCYPTLANCQINHNVWYGDFEVRSNSLLLPACANLVDGFINGFVVGYHAGYNGEKVNLSELEYTSYYKWLKVSPAYDIHVPKWKLYDANGEIPTQGPDWWKCLLFGDFRHNYNFSLGYSLHWRSYDIPFGANFGVNYEWRGLYVKEGELAGFHKTSGVVPSATLSWFVLGNNFEREYNWNIVAEAGASYVKTLFYNNPLQLGKDKVNSGWRGLAAIGFKYNRDCFFLRYEMDFYDYFNLPQTRTRMNNMMISGFVRMF